MTASTTILRTRLHALLQQGITAFLHLSQRERLLVVAALGTVIVMIAVSLIRNTVEAFSQQSLRLLQLQSERAQIADGLGRYAELKANRETVEKAYKAAELKEDLLAHLERLIKEKAGITQQRDYNLRSISTAPFGGNFEQNSYLVTFQTTDLQKLVDFMKEVVSGQKPLLLKKIDLRKLGPDRLKVELEISSIRQVR